MKRILLTIALLLLTVSAFCQNNLPFSKGINMLTYFESWDKGVLPNLNKHDEADFACLKDMGVEVIRLPVHFENLMEPYATGKIYDIIFDKLDMVCDWAEKYQIYLVIDNHSFNSEEEDNTWKQSGLRLQTAIKTEANTSFMKLSMNQKAKVMLNKSGFRSSRKLSTL